mmetsp:Transcript_5697/g.16108  ORF Transcript_5697/g.16108 Transcript_5697/m.16108 type:complete len:435 (-) Transcript_5697:480-1784(-)
MATRAGHRLPVVAASGSGRHRAHVGGPARLRGWQSAPAEAVRAVSEWEGPAAGDTESLLPNGTQEPGRWYLRGHCCPLGLFSYTNPRHGSRGVARAHAAHHRSRSGLLWMVGMDGPAWQQQQQQQDQAPPPAAAAAAVAAAMIEVERKFPMLDESDLERAIEREGGQLVGEQAFVDTYFDWEGYPLTLHNCWLRRRAGLWELKTPRGVTKEGGDQYSGHEGEGRLAIFEEELDEDKIVQYLKTHFADHMTSDDLKTAVAEETPGGGTRAGLQAFCHYGTNRRKYVAGDPAITIDVDSASFGYGCVELERMCVSDEETAAATRDIDSMAKRLNLASSIAQTGEHAPAPQSAPQPSADGRKLSLGLPSSGPLSLGIPLRGEPESPPPRGVGGGLPLGSQGGPHRAAMSVQRGKLEEWIRRYSPQHFDLLKDAKIFQ